MIGSRRQVTIPGDAMNAARLHVGDRLRARATGAGQIVLEREVDPLHEFLGALTGVYDGFNLDALREQWRDGMKPSVLRRL